MSVFSERNLEGYLEIDHRESPGFSAEEAVSIGLRRIVDKVGKGQRAQIPTRLCAHCEKLVILNPARTRDRDKCPNCWGYICDACGVAMKAGRACKPFAQWIDEWAAASANGKVLMRKDDVLGGHLVISRDEYNDPKTP